MAKRKLRKTPASKVKPKNAKADAVQGQILETASKLKEAIERKDQPALKKLLSSARFWLFDRPGKLDDFLQTLAKLTGGSEDLELCILKMAGLELHADRAVLSVETQMLWTNESTWEEDELSAIMHIGFAKPGGSWKIDHLGLTRREAPAQERPPQAPRAAAKAFEPSEDLATYTAYFGMPTSPSPTSFGANPLAGVVPYFGSPDLVVQAEDEKTMPLIPVYIPEFILTDVLKKLLKK